MWHVCQKVGADLVGDGAEGREINRAQVGRVATDDQLGAVLQAS